MFNLNERVPVTKKENVLAVVAVEVELLVKVQKGRKLVQALVGN